MLILAINTASTKTAIALIDKKVLEKSWKSKNNEAEKLLPLIATLLKKSKKKFSDIKKVIVVKGPGSFTGLRIGVTVANTIAYLNNCELYGIDTFEYWRSINKETALLIYAGSGGVYASIGNKKPELINIPDLNKFLKTNHIKKVFGEISPEQKKMLKNVSFVQTKLSFGRIIEKMYPEIVASKSVKMVEPLYVKKPQISERKNLL